MYKRVIQVSIAAIVAFSLLVFALAIVSSLGYPVSREVVKNTAFLLGAVVMGLFLSGIVVASSRKWK